MSVRNGRARFANRGKTEPSVRQLAGDKSYAELALRGAIGKGALLSMARKGDSDAKAALAKLDGPEPDLDARTEGAGDA